MFFVFSFFPTEEYTPLPHITYLAVVVFVLVYPSFASLMRRRRRRRRIDLACSKLQREKLLLLLLLIDDELMMMMITYHTKAPRPSKSK